MKTPIRIQITDFTKEDQPLIDKLREAGIFVYHLRDWDDEEEGYNIEVYAIVNRIGFMLSDTDLSPFMHDNLWIGSDKLFGMNNIEIMQVATLICI